MWIRVDQIFACKSNVSFNLKISFNYISWTINERMVKRRQSHKVGGASAAVPGASAAVPGASAAVPGASAAVPGKNSGTDLSIWSPSTWPTPFMIYLVMAGLNLLNILYSYNTKKTAFPLKSNRMLDISSSSVKTTLSGKTLPLETTTTSEHGTGVSIIVTSDETTITGAKVMAIAVGDGYQVGDTITISKAELNVDANLGTVDGPLVVTITEEDLNKTPPVTAGHVGLSMISVCIFAWLMWWLCIHGHTTLAWIFLLLPVILLIAVLLLFAGALKAAY
jgi:hypothetical protein